MVTEIQFCCKVVQKVLETLLCCWDLGEMLTLASWVWWLSNSACGWGLLTLDHSGLLPLRSSWLQMPAVSSEEIQNLKVNFFGRKLGCNTTKRSRVHTTCVTKPLYYSRVFLISSMWKQGCYPLAKGEGKERESSISYKRPYQFFGWFFSVLWMRPLDWGVFLASGVGAVTRNILLALSFWLLTFSSVNVQLSASLDGFLGKPLLVSTMWTERAIELMVREPCFKVLRKTFQHHTPSPSRSQHSCSS